MFLLGLCNFFIATYNGLDLIWIQKFTTVVNCDGDYITNSISGNHLFKCDVNSANEDSLALQIIANLKADPFLSYDELSELMGVPRRTIVRRIKELADAGKIHRIGSSKSGHWEV